MIELVDEGQDRDAPHPADLEQLQRLRLDALRAIEHHHGAVGRGQRAVGVLAEILVSGRIQQVEPIALVLELQHGRGDRDAALALHRHPVRCGVALGFAAAHGPGQLDRAAVEQQLLGQGGLAGVGVRNDREGAPARNLAAQHVGLIIRRGRLRGK